MRKAGRRPHGDRGRPGRRGWQCSSVQEEKGHRTNGLLPLACDPLIGHSPTEPPGILSACTDGPHTAHHFLYSVNIIMGGGHMNVAWAERARSCRHTIHVLSLPEACARAVLDARTCHGMRAPVFASPMVALSDTPALGVVAGVRVRQGLCRPTLFGGLCVLPPCIPCWRRPFVMSVS
jgi:hypothetical protein